MVWVHSKVLATFTDTSRICCKSAFHTWSIFSISVKYLNKNTNVIMIRCGRGVYKLVQSSIPFIKSLGKVEMFFNTLHVAGRVCYWFWIVYLVAFTCYTLQNSFKWVHMRYWAIDWSVGLSTSESELFTQILQWNLIKC